MAFVSSAKIEAEVEIFSVLSRKSMKNISSFARRIRSMICQSKKSFTMEPENGVTRIKKTLHFQIMYILILLYINILIECRIL